MIFDWKRKLLATAVIVGAVGGFLAFRAWLSGHDLRLQAEAAAKAQQAVQQQAQQQIADLQKQMAGREAQFQSAVQSLNTKFAAAATPDQQAQLASELMGLTRPIQVLIPPASDGTRPEAVAQLPQSDFPQAKAYLQQCEECKAERGKLVADAADRAAQQALAQKQIDALKTERDAWKTAAKGGTKMQRFVQAVKWFALGAGAGAAVVCGSGHCQ